MENKVNVITVPVTKIFPNIWNPNVQSDFIYEREIKSIQTFGMVTPLLAREIPEGYEIIDGEHRWRAAKDLGFEEIPVNNLGKVTDSVAKQLTIILNETKGRPDTAKLGDLMKDLESVIGFEDLSAIMPYSEDELRAFIDNTDVDFSTLEPHESKTPSEGDWESVTFRLPTEVAEQVRAQVHRFKIAIAGGESVKDVSDVVAVEAMMQNLFQIPDDQLV